MKKNILLLLTVLSFIACNRSLKEDLSEVDSLLLSIKEIEASFFSIDTSRVFEVKRKMEKDFKEFHSFKDTITKEEALRLDEIFGSKKKIFRFYNGYSNLIGQIEFSKKQLNNLKQDLENELVSKKDFNYYSLSEKEAVKELRETINKLTQGVEVSVQKYELDREDLMNIIMKRKQNL